MAFDEFRCVVFGNEPAGLWLLAQLEKLYTEMGEEPRLAWVSLGGEPPPVCFPTAVGPAFGVNPLAPWSAEILTPRQSLPWNAKTLAERFSALPAIDSTRPVLDSLTSPTSQDWNAIRAAIAKHPELIGLAQGMWKALGRTQQQTPESVVHFSRYLTSLQWWSPERELGGGVKRIALSASQNSLEKFQQRRSSHASVQLRQFGEITSEKWVLNLDLRTLWTWGGRCAEFFKQLNLEWDPSTLRALYPLRLRVESDAIPTPMPPLTLAFDTHLIPDPQTEIWPIVLHAAEEERELTLWADAPGLVSLEAVLDQFGQGMQRLHRLFPFLSRKLVSVSVPLGMDSCFSEEERRSVADELQHASIEKYLHTGFYTETRSPSISLLLPFQGCHLPYPLGSLAAARKILVGLAPKKKKSQPVGRGLDGQPNAG